MSDFKFSLAIKGAEAIVAQLKLKLEGERVHFDRLKAEGKEPSSIDIARHNGYKYASWDAIHTLGEMRFHEMYIAGKYATKPTAEEIAKHEAELAEYDDKR